LKIKAVVHEAEEGSYWAEVPAIRGCATQGETMEELVANVHEAIEACLDVEVDPPEHTPKDRVLEIALGSPSPDSWQPSHLRQVGQHRPVVNPHPR
jgi:predicted RNase H-like HicB family nuclease